MDELEKSAWFITQGFYFFSAATRFYFLLN